MKVNVLVGLHLVKVKATKLSIFFLILEEKKCSIVASMCL